VSESDISWGRAWRSCNLLTRCNVNSKINLGARKLTFGSTAKKSSATAWFWAGSAEASLGTAKPLRESDCLWGSFLTIAPYQYQLRCAVAELTKAVPLRIPRVQHVTTFSCTAHCAHSLFRLHNGSLVAWSLCVHT
jgi:hypothetical protein